MKKVALPAVLLLAYAFSALAQSESYSTSTSEDGAQMESRVTLSPAPLSALAPDVCTANATTLCLNNSRFQARAIFSAPSLGITNAPAQAVPLTGDTGYFWFFSANNVEITLKVVDGRTFNGFFWAFYAALSDVAYTITITDMDTGAVKTYSNTQGSLASVADVTAFAGGSTPSGNYNGSWSGTTSQGKTISFTIANNVITAFSIRYQASGTCGTVEGPFTFTTPGMSGNGFTIATQGSISFVVTVNGTFNSGTSASGTVSASLSPPTTACNMSGSGTWTATKS